MTHKIRRPRGRPISPEHRAKLRRLVDAVGPREAAERLGVSRTALVHALADLDILRGTALAIVAGLSALEGVRTRP
jgi:hypothetical protein